MLSAERSLLVDAREEFLRAALLRPGHIETARRITTITRRLRELEAVIEQQRAEEKQRREKLAETIQRLQKLTVRQERLAQRSLRILSRRRRSVRRRCEPPGTPRSLPPDKRAGPPGAAGRHRATGRA